MVDRDTLSQVKLCCELLCDSHKRNIPQRVHALIEILAKLIEEQPMTKRRAEILVKALLESSDGTKEDFTIIGEGEQLSIYIETPMLIHLDALARRLIW